MSQVLELVAMSAAASAATGTGTSAPGRPFASSAGRQDAARWDVAALREIFRDQLGDAHQGSYPQELEKGFPHVLARIVSLWGTAPMDEYFQSLLVSDRPGRQGFPAAVAREILMLSLIHDVVAAAGRQQAVGRSGHSGIVF